MKRLICCLDGTWNNDDDETALTNVVKLHRSILPVDQSGVQQHSHYVTGIASDKNTSAQFLKGAIGFEVDDRIRAGYQFLVDNYVADDEIFLFGFSRGAFEARSLAGFLALFGVARTGSEFSLEEAWELYRQAPARRNTAELSKLRAVSHFPLRIKCVGVWDTVGNIGNPFFSSGFIGRRAKYHDTQLQPFIDVALHALSIDEKRGPFSPSLWTRPKNTAPQSNQHVEQVWFPGVHADVGGGYPETELSDISLLWMAEQTAAKAGLAFDHDALATKPNPHGLQHVSATGAIFKWSSRLPFIRLIHQSVRGIPPLRRWILRTWRSSKVDRGLVTVNERVHESAIARYGKPIHLATGAGVKEVIYQPRNLAPLMAKHREARLTSTGQAAGAGANTGEVPHGTTKLVTVHGTGAGDRDSHGTRWWQLGSPFQAEISKRLTLDAANVEIVPFQWDIGPNSENSRRAAGIALHTMLKGYDSAGVDYHVIGHSHGGSVIHHALMHSVAVGEPLEQLKSWCTVGTPFLDYRPNRFMFNRLGGTGLTLYASAIGAIILAIVLNARVLGTVLTTSSRWIEWIAYAIGTLPLLVYGIVCLLALYIYERYFGDVRPAYVKKRVADRYADRWIGLWHREDEAISALTNVKRLNVPIVGSNLFDPIVALVPVLLLAAFAGLVAAQPASPEAILLQLNAYIEEPVRWIGLAGQITKLMEFLQAMLPDQFRDAAIMVTLGLAVTACVAIMVAVYVLLARPIVMLLKALAKVVGSPTAKLINGIVWSAVRGQAWGDDRVSEGVDQIGAHPPEFAPQFVALPDAVADELSRFSEKNAILTLTKVRDLLGMTPEPRKSADIRTQLSEQLNWQELIHTTYFDVSQFVDLIAICLHRAGLSELNDDYWETNNRDAALDWHQAITPAIVSQESRVSTEGAIS